MNVAPEKRATPSAIVGRHRGSEKVHDVETRVARSRDPMRLSGSAKRADPDAAE